MISSPALAKELKLRWDKIQQNMSDVHADGLLICDNVNLYYVSGRIFRGYCYIPVKGEPIFFVRRPLGLNGTQVVYIRKPEEIGEYLQKNGIAFPDKLLLESDSISYSDYKRYETIFTPKEVLNGTALLRRCRSIKTPYEIDLIRRSGELHAKAYETIPSLYRKGMTDVEFSIELEHECRKLGSLGIFRIFGQSMEIFMGSVLAGDNADIPSPYDFAMGGAGLDVSLPVGCNGTVLTEGMSLMVDMGGNFTGYMTDMTRTYAIGSVQELAMKAHEPVLALPLKIYMNWQLKWLIMPDSLTISWDTVKKLVLLDTVSASRSMRPRYWHLVLAIFWRRVWCLLSSPNSSFQEPVLSVLKTPMLSLLMGSRSSQYSKKN